MEGRKAPPPIVTNISYEDPNSTSSPQDAHLQKRKVERQQQPHTKGLLRPSQLSGNAIPSPDSPGMQRRLDLIADGADPTDRSSPVGTALLKRKAAREHQGLDHSMPRACIQDTASAPPRLDR
ncbi:hypothetical protein AB1Y20_002335 [Prymnesium parvum]|uniref:Uncharacterized protein n=1 Tax=Prymnesium parvum TaxID=97485 RepID=A0AB34J8V1_PRYPA